MEENSIAKDAKTYSELSVSAEKICLILSESAQVGDSDDRLAMFDENTAAAIVGESERLGKLTVNGLEPVIDALSEARSIWSDLASIMPESDQGFRGQWSKLKISASRFLNEKTPGDFSELPDAEDGKLIWLIRELSTAATNISILASNTLYEQTKNLKVGNIAFDPNSLGGEPVRDLPSVEVKVAIWLRQIVSAYRQAAGIAGE